MIYSPRRTHCSSNDTSFIPPPTTPLAWFNLLSLQSAIKMQTPSMATTGIFLTQPRYPSTAIPRNEASLAQLWESRGRKNARKRAENNAALRALGRSTAPHLPIPTIRRCIFPRLRRSIIGTRKDGLKGWVRQDGKSKSAGNRLFAFAEELDTIFLIPKRTPRKGSDGARDRPSHHPESHSSSKPGE